jgi:hypothetical protein
MTPAEAVALRAVAAKLRDAATSAHRAFQAARDGDTGAAMDAAHAAASAATKAADTLDLMGRRSPR